MRLKYLSALKKKTWLYKISLKKKLKKSSLLKVLQKEDLKSNVRANII